MEISGIISLVSQRSSLVLEPVEVGMRGKTGAEQLVGLNRKKTWDHCSYTNRLLPYKVKMFL